MKFDLGSLSVLVALFAPLAALSFAFAIDRRRREREEKPPQTEKLLRPPGHSLSIRFDETIEKLLRNIFAACVFSAFAGASAVVVTNLLAVRAPLFILSIFVVVLALFTAAGIFSALRAFGKMTEAQNIRLGLRGEQAVAEALHEAADCGLRVFHDLPGGDDWNIDHVAVGSRGVFLIETKAYRRRSSRNGQAEHEVIYDGNSLQFPFYKTDKPIEQAKRNAKWLSNYLGKKTGESVRVESFVVLPGWFVKSSGKADSPVNVMNAKYLVRFLQLQDEKIAPTQVRRIITALDEKCRDLEF